MSLASCETETIVAIATPSGQGGVGVVRISGPQAKTILSQLTGVTNTPKPRYASLVSFRDAKGAIIDRGIAIYFHQPNSFTGEDVVELQGHGGPVVMRCLLERVVALGARQARPGEFSERAFLNKKIDLAQAEAIADLIAAGSEQAARSAMRSLDGFFSSRVNALFTAITQLRMLVEGAIDFPDEDIDFLAERDIVGEVSALINTAQQLIGDAKQGVILQQGITLVIFGAPNAGKSTLLNRFTGAETAIVTEVPGTTRDVLREAIHLEGVPIHVVDTAGLRDSGDAVEQEGIRRAKQEIEKADLLLLVTDMTQPEHLSTLLQDNALPKGVPIIIVKNKMDLIENIAHDVSLRTSEAILKNQNTSTASLPISLTSVSLSAKTGEGMDRLVEAIKEQIGYTEREPPFIARQRHVDALINTAEQLKQGHEAWPTHQAGELLAQDLSEAQDALGAITGRISADDLLGEIFSKFCIGK